MAQQGNGHQVTQGHQSHGHIRQAPGQIQTGQRPKQHHARYQEPIDHQNRFALRDESDIGLSIIVITKDTAISEEQNGYRYKDMAETADLMTQGLLGQLNAIDRTIQRNPTEEDDKSGTGTDDQGIGKDTQGLNQSLLDRMRYLGRSSCIGGRSHPGLVAEEPSFDALHQSGPHHSSASRIPLEGTGKDLTKDTG